MTESRIAKALKIAVDHGGTDGDHHKRWVIDQMVRALTGCPMVPARALDCRGRPYEFEEQGESDEYVRLVAEARAGDDGPETYTWDTGTPP